MSPQTSSVLPSTARTKSVCASLPAGATCCCAVPPSSPTPPPISCRISSGFLWKIRLTITTRMMPPRPSPRPPPNPPPPPPPPSSSTTLSLRRDFCQSMSVSLLAPERPPAPTLLCRRRKPQAAQASLPRRVQRCSRSSPATAAYVPRSVLAEQADGLARIRQQRRIDARARLHHRGLGAEHRVHRLQDAC